MDGQGGVDHRDVEDDEDLGGEGDAEEGPGLPRGRLAVVVVRGGWVSAALGARPAWWWTW